MRDQVYNKKTSMSDHVQILETLREEITIMTERKLDLERRIEALYAEREGLSSTLDESADRIVMLEKEGRERDCLVSNSASLRTRKYSDIFLPRSGTSRRSLTNSSLRTWLSMTGWTRFTEGESKIRP